MSASGAGARSQSHQRLEQALAAFLRQEFGASVAAIIGFTDILLEDARRDGLSGWIADLERMKAAGVQLSALITGIIEADRQGGAVLESRLRHELRTPLTAIKGYGELLAEEALDDGRDEHARDLAQVLEHADRLLGEIDRIVAFTGGDEAAPAPVEAEIEAVHSVLSQIRPLDAGPEPPPSRQSHILIVDDNAANRDLLSRRLKREGHRVSLAESGAAALALAASGDLDLVLLDLMMPGISGFEVLRRLKAAEATRHIPVVMISALDEIDSIVRSIEAGAEDYLPKPFNPVLLRARINASLEKKRLRDREQAAILALRAEKEHSETLLLNILPKTIVMRMRNGERVIADRIAEATILFSDLVGFTELAARLSPERIIELLGFLFSRFDALAARHGLEKIKTIGDAYMVAGGIPEARPDHAAAMAEMALEMRDTAAAARRIVGETLELRIGIHTGALVAGVIGTHKFAYDVWGDTVNTASRMENLGLPGHIHISAATRAALGDSFRVEPRGPVEVKGKGLMETYFLLGR
ncbi:MAG TPA: adenylate/guanylate cyclase domain-containing protein [Stellaceae bacterium]|nr:adenylate/guanylate cyclase domain-containing protein [Stellaceae bacterium]